MDWPVYAGGQSKKRESPVKQEQLYREMMKIYASFMRDGVSPKQIDETDLQDWFAMFRNDEASGQHLKNIDDVMGR